MNKQQLITTVADATNLSTAQATQAVNTVLEAIAQAVASGDKVTLAGWGVFTLAHRPAATRRNPSTGEPIEVGESWKPKWKPGKAFVERCTEVQRAAGGTESTRG